MKIKLTASTCLSLIIEILLLANCGSALAAGASDSWSADNPVRVDSGWLAGQAASPKVRVFKGIPYAAPPIGRLRWRPPQPVIAWKGIRKADEFGPSCIQIHLDPAAIAYGGPHPTSEDCLYLNVWTSAQSPDERLPVLIWIHDGAFLWGEGTRAITDGEALSRKGAVVITINYRLGVFGFLAHPELSRESEKHVSGNYGLLDMIAAIKWARRKIAAFGGDPNRITIFGESAGSRAASALSTSPLVKGEIRGVIAADTIFTGASTLAEAERQGAGFVSASGATSIAQLREMPAERLFPSAYSKIVSDGYFFNYVVDGWVLNTDNVFAAEQVDAENGIAVLTGSTAGFGTTVTQPTSTIAFSEQAKRVYHSQAGELLDLYPAVSDSEAASSLINMTTDQVAWLHNKWAAQHARNGHRAYLYCFTHEIPPPPGVRYNFEGDPLPKHLGAFHTGEISYMFDSLAKLGRAWTPSDYELADIVSSYWINFASNGDPNGAGLPPWPAYGDEPRPVMELGDQVRPIPPLLSKAKNEFWASYFRNSGTE